MNKVNLRAWLLVGSVILLMTGCVSNKRHNREIGVLQSQVNTLASEVSRLDAQTQADGAQAVRGGEAAIPRGEVAGEFVSSTMYRTPSGFEVPAADIQRALKAAGYFSGEIDGKVGPKTREGLRAFQRDNNLTPDGVCGRKTWELLKTHLSSASSAIK